MNFEQKGVYHSLICTRKWKEKRFYTTVINKFLAKTSSSSSRMPFHFKCYSFQYVNANDQFVDLNNSFFKLNVYMKFAPKWIGRVVFFHSKFFSIEIAEKFKFIWSSCIIMIWSCTDQYEIQMKWTISFELEIEDSRQLSTTPIFSETHSKQLKHLFASKLVSYMDVLRIKCPLCERNGDSLKSHVPIDGIFLNENYKFIENHEFCYFNRRNKDFTFYTWLLNFECVRKMGFIKMFRVINVIKIWIAPIRCEIVLDNIYLANCKHFWKLMILWMISIQL